MKLTTCADTPAQWRGEVLALAVPQGPADQNPLDGPWLAAVDAALDGAVSRLLAYDSFSGARDELVTGPGVPARCERLVLIGLGRPDAVTPHTARRAGAALARTLTSGPNRRVALALESWHVDGTDLTEHLTEGLSLAVHCGRWNVLPDRFRADYGADLPREPETVELLGAASAEPLTRAEAFTDALVLARELVAAPANLITPDRLAREATALAAAHDRFDVEVWDEEQCRAQGLTGICAAAAGSAAPARFIRLSHRPATPSGPPVAVIGLGLTYDDRGVARSGGAVEGAKKYMAGAGALLGAATALATLGGTREAHLLIPAVAKTAGPNALHLGDLVTTASGLTVEVNHPDAHGRLMMADALHLAARLGAERTVGVSALGLPVAAALGPKAAALWSTDDDLAADLTAAGHEAGELLWRLPLVDEYEDELWAPFANLRSAGPAGGDGATAATFLRRFAPQGAWAHLEITEPAWSPRIDGYYNAGATGYGAGTLARWLCCP
ncbi:M17 family peptidase N-terminal domain-containing protein [Streptomyces sp. NPDC005727]|uniref:leucyl aminopeptidase family protein n=1 Tax=unclassified Streptomyces TaxID=2593676 RepID=UPI0033FCA234